MKVLDRGIRYTFALGVGILAALYGGSAGAQENLYANKTPAQIFASDCAICHKSPQGLSKAGGAFGLGLERFLREHYTASRESAAAIANYIQAMDTGPAAPEKGNRRSAKPSAKKLPDTKPTEAKPGEAKPSGTKPADKKAEPADSKTEVKTEAKPEPKAQPEPKTEAKPSEPKPADAAKPEKSD